MKNGFTSIEIGMVLLLVVILGTVAVVGFQENKQYNRLMEQCLKVKPEFECVGILQKPAYRKY